MGVLERILQSKGEELGRLRQQRLPEPPALRAVQLRRSPGTPLRLLAEIKRRSPSAGPLSTRLSVAERAAAYQRGGAHMVSVLCDQTYFDGNHRHLSEARQACSLPLLCKDFVVDELQLDAARAWGADAVLLIVRCLSPKRLADLFGGCVERGLEPLVEITTPEEARVALDAGAKLVGVNARDLDTLELCAERAAEVLDSLPEQITSVHLSGLESPDDVRRVACSATDAALVGEALMRLDDPEPLLTQLVAAAG